MKTVLALGAGALVTWVLRTVFIALVPADRLPARVRRMLRHVGPAMLGAMIVTLLVGHGGLPALVTPSARHLALLVAGLVAWRVRNVAVSMAAALAVMVAAALLT
jgi:branched-subunit amino acid transport protein